MILFLCCKGNSMPGEEALKDKPQQFFHIFCADLRNPAGRATLFFGQSDRRSGGRKGCSQYGDAGIYHRWEQCNIFLLPMLRHNCRTWCHRWEAFCRSGTHRKTRSFVYTFRWPGFDVTDDPLLRNVRKDFIEQPQVDPVIFHCKLKVVSDFFSGPVSFRIDVCNRTILNFRLIRSGR